MTQPFQTGAQNITLKEAPWSVKREISIYVKLVGDKLYLYDNEKCTGNALSPASFPVYKGQSTGLYFFIYDEDPNSKTHFPDPDDGVLPLSWDKDKPCPGTVLYGKVRDDLKAFSISDVYNHNGEVKHSFDLVVVPPGGGPFVHTSWFDKVDPTIVEKGEEPPPDGC